MHGLFSKRGQSTARSFGHLCYVDRQLVQSTSKTMSEKVLEKAAKREKDKYLPRALLLICVLDLFCGWNGL